MAAERAATYLNLAYPNFSLPCVVPNESETNHQKNWKHIRRLRQSAKWETNRRT